MQTDPHKIAAGLSEAMRAAMVHPSGGGYSFGWASLATLEALRKRGLVGHIAGPGSMWSPQTSIQWPFTPLGLAVRGSIAGAEPMTDMHPHDGTSYAQGGIWTVCFRNGNIGKAYAHSLHWIWADREPSEFDILACRPWKPEDGDLPCP